MPAPLPVMCVPVFADVLEHARPLSPLALMAHSMAGGKLLPQVIGEERECMHFA